MYYGVMTMILVAAAMGVGCQSNTRPLAGMLPCGKLPHKILFVGNSFTYYNGGLENHVKQLAQSACPPHRIEADRSTQGGATLQIHQSRQAVHERIAGGGYDVVVLQEDIPELKEHRLEPFSEQARRFDAEIRSAGSRCLLFMAWPYTRLNWVTLDQIAQAHRRIGQELGVPVAPVGLAFERSLHARPELAMLGRDKEHETLSGTYLAACVIYANLFGESPVGLVYHPPGVTAEQAGFLQRIAWRTVRDWQKGP